MCTIILFHYDIISVTVQEKIVKKQKDKFALGVGDSIQIDCWDNYDIENTLSWYFGDRNIYNYNKGCVEYPAEENKYHVERNEQNFTLHIKDTTLRDSGTYKCLTLSEVKMTNLVIFGKYNIKNFKSNAVTISYSLRIT